MEAKHGNDEAARQITPIKSDDAEAKEGSFENISPSNSVKNDDEYSGDCNVSKEQSFQYERDVKEAINSPLYDNQDQGWSNSSNPDWPLTGITEPGPNDCLFGRGGGTNHHPGNKKYRKMVEDKKDKYLSSKRLDKPLVAMEIINEWRSMNPPGRFLKQDEVTKLWEDVGDRKAREKTSQALREKTPGDYKETRFEPGTVSPGRMKPNLARDHSLGTETMGAHEMSLEGFSWDDSDQPVIDRRGANLNNHHPEASPYSPYHVRQNSLATNPLPEASTTNPAPPFGDPYYHHYHPHYPPSPHHYPYPPPPPHYQSPQGHHQYHSSTPTSAGRQREHSLQMNPLKGANTTQPARDTFTDPNYEGQAPPPYPPPHPSYYYPPVPPHHWGQPPPPPPQYYPGGHPSAFSQYDAMRSPNNSSEYDDRRASGASSNRIGEEEEPAGTFQDFTKIASLIRDSTEGSTLARSSSADESGRGSSDHSIQKSHSMPLQNEGAFPSPPKNASTKKKVGGESLESKDVRKPSLLKKISGGALQNLVPVPAPTGALRPEPVKRDTSNQPETLETKRSTKRVILSRDKSAIAKSLKEAQRQKDEMAGSSSKLSKADLDRNLSVEMNKLGLIDAQPSPSLNRMTTTDVLGEFFDDDNLASPLSPPEALAENDRMPTVDALAHDMLTGGNRLQSVEWDDTLDLLVEGSDEADTDPGAVAVNEDIAARWISGTSVNNGVEI
jgi:hypothetical protein